MRTVHDADAQGAARVHDAQVLSLDDYVALPRVGAVAASPCGTWLAVAVQRLHSDGARFVSDLWRVPCDGAPPVQLTRGDTRDAAPCFRHDGTLAFLSNRRPLDGKPDEEADKRMQVWVLPHEGGEPYPLTDEPLGVDAFRCAKHADAMLLVAPVLPDVAHAEQRTTASARAKHGTSALKYHTQPVRYWDHWLHDPKTGARAHLIVMTGTRRTDLTPQAASELAIDPQFDIAADGTHGVVTWATPGVDRIPDSALAVFDLATGARVALIDAGPRAALEAPAFSPDGMRIAALRGVRRDGVPPTLDIVSVARGGGALAANATDWDTWPTAVHGWSADGRAILVGADLHGRTRVFAIDAATGRREALLGDGSYGSIVTVGHDRLAGTRMTVRQPPEAFIAPVAPNATPRTLARLCTHDAMPDVDVEEVEVPSTDGVPIHTFIVKPRGARGPLPAVMFIHGGPISAFGDQWHWRWNAALLAQRGYLVALPNARGSTGYGRDFIAGIWGNAWGGQCYRDLMAVADAVAARPDVDAKRFAAMGGSFGGYMSNWIGTQTDRFACLITHASVFAMSPFAATTDLPAFWYYEMGWSLDTPAADMDRYSPAAHVRQWKTPVLVIHGEKDYRCPVSESLMLFEALQRQGVPSELLVFPDENHWILKPRNIVAWYEHVFDFLGRHLRP